MSEWNLKSPLLAGMKVLSCLSQNGGFSTYLLKSEFSQERYVFKCISVPESQTHIDGLKFSGAIQSDEEAAAYYNKEALVYQTELETLSRLAESGHIASYTDWRILQKDDEIGFDIHLLSPYRRSLNEYLEGSAMSQAKAAKLALDLCHALAELRMVGFVHCNLKPENIYLTATGNFILGDLGLLPVNNLRFATVPQRVLGKYSAPELFDVMQCPNDRVDIYSLGLLLYNIYNGGHSPFEDEQTTVKGANEKRLAGHTLPAPLFADYEIAAIILKACAANPADRYPTPDAMIADLDDYVLRNEPNDTLIVPPIMVDDDILLTEDAIQEELTPMHFAKAEELDESFRHHFAPDADVLNESIEAIRGEQADAVSAETNPEPAKDSAEEVAEVSVDAAAAEEPTSGDGESTEDTPVAESEESSTEEPATKEMKIITLPRWAWITGLGVAALGLIISAYMLLVPNVSGHTLVHSDANSLEFRLKTAHGADFFHATCVDSYGNRFHATMEDGVFRFAELSPGTQYTVRLKTSVGLGIRGVDSFTATTALATQVEFFVAKPMTESEVELSFGIQGRDQEQWVILAQADDGTSREIRFSGHSVLVKDLSPNTAYVFTLQNSAAISLSGQTTVTYDTTSQVTVEDIHASYTDEGVVLTWTFLGRNPGKWSVLYTTPAGEKKEVVAEKSTIEIPYIEPETDYFMEIFCSGMTETATITVHKHIPTMTAFQATANADGTVTVTWSSAEDVPQGWRVVAKPKGETTKLLVQNASGNSATISGLPPKMELSISVHPTDGWAVNGTNAADITTADSKKFSSYGCTSTYLALFRRPTKENWKPTDLSTSKTAFQSGETIAFALEALSGVKKSNDTVNVCLAIRNTDGTLIGGKVYSSKWNDMWSGKLFAGELSLADVPAGSYNLYVYFNSQYVSMTNFTVQ